MTEPVNSGVYKIANTITGDFYIGSAVDLRRRWSEHRSALVNNRHCNAHLQNSWNKHGAEAFTFEVVELCEREWAVEREQLCMDLLKPTYNMAPTAGSQLGYKHSDATRAKISKNSVGMTGKHHTDESNRKNSESHMGTQTGALNGMFGKSGTDQRGALNRNFGKTPSDATRAAMSASHTGTLNHNFGKTLTDEHRHRLSEAAKRYWAAK